MMHQYCTGCKSKIQDIEFICQDNVTVVWKIFDKNWFPTPDTKSFLFLYLIVIVVKRYSEDMQYVLIYTIISLATFGWYLLGFHYLLYCRRPQHEGNTNIRYRTFTDISCIKPISDICSCSTLYNHYVLGFCPWIFTTRQNYHEICMKAHTISLEFSYHPSMKF